MIAIFRRAKIMLFGEIMKTLGETASILTKIENQLPEYSRFILMSVISSLYASTQYY